MKKIFNILSVCAAASLVLTACDTEKFLNPTSPSTVDAGFVFSNMETANASMYGVYESWRSVCNNQVFAAGLFYALDVAGSDIERHPEAFSNQPGRHWMECLYQNGAFTSEYGLTTYLKDNASGAYNMLFDVVGKANAVIGAIESMDDYDAMVSSAAPSDLGQLYGEAICARAVAYRELLKYHGDVPYSVKAGVAAGGLAPRDSVYECVIADLERVIPLMRPVGDVAKNKFSKTFAQGLIGRLCLDAGGYQTRRADLGADFYKGADGKVLSFETKGQPNKNADNAVYGRRSDWKTFYEKAAKYYKEVIANSGSAVWHDTDPRKNEEKRVYNNPYQYFFQQLNDFEYADESIYEYAMTQGSSNERPYSSGRPSNGGGSWAFPCKNYGQARINPAHQHPGIRLHGSPDSQRPHPRDDMGSVFQGRHHRICQERQERARDSGDQPLAKPPRGRQGRGAVKPETLDNLSAAAEAYPAAADHPRIYPPLSFRHFAACDNLQRGC